MDEREEVGVAVEVVKEPVEAAPDTTRPAEGNGTKPPAKLTRKGKWYVEGGEELSDWKRKAFVLLYQKKRSGQTLEEISGLVHKRVETLSRWYNSEEYKALAKTKTRKDYQELAPLAIETLRDILVSGNSEVARKDAALKVLAQLNLEDDLRDEIKQQVMQQFNLQVNIGNVENMDLREIRGAKAELFKKLEAAIGQGSGPTNPQPAQDP